MNHRKAEGCLRHSRHKAFLESPKVTAVELKFYVYFIEDSGYQYERYQFCRCSDNPPIMLLFDYHWPGAHPGKRYNEFACIVKPRELGIVIIEQQNDDPAD